MAILRDPTGMKKIPLNPYRRVEPRKMRLVKFQLELIMLLFHQCGKRANLRRQRAIEFGPEGTVDQPVKTHPRNQQNQCRSDRGAKQQT